MQSSFTVMLFQYSKRKFQSLSIESQHKKCAELLRIHYIHLIKNETKESVYENYCEMLRWMNIDFKLGGEAKEVADRYHFHLKLAKQNILEPRLLPSIRKGDREESEKISPYGVYLDRLRSAHNVGSIIRTVEAFAFGSIYFSEQTPFIDNKQVKDVAMGATEWVPCYKEKKLNELTRPLIALETSAHAISLYDFIFPDNFTLIVGNEEYGCSEASLKQADIIIEIPLRGRKNSINVANAFAITVGEVQRQKKECNEKENAL